MKNYSEIRNECERILSQHDSSQSLKKKIQEIHGLLNEISWNDCVLEELDDRIEDLSHWFALLKAELDEACASQDGWFAASHAVNDVYNSMVNRIFLIEDDELFKSYMKKAIDFLKASINFDLFLEFCTAEEIKKHLIERTL